MTIEEQVQEQFALNALTRIVKEWKRASLLHPKWPDDVIHAAAILAEEAGETLQAALDITYKAKTQDERDEGWAHVAEEAIQAGAMALRILIGMGGYKLPELSQPATIEASHE
jgi:hypothetical protein